jgi:hypothetical protein
MANSNLNSLPGSILGLIANDQDRGTVGELAIGAVTVIKERHGPHLIARYPLDRQLIPSDGHLLDREPDIALADPEKPARADHDMEASVFTLYNLLYVTELVSALVIDVHPFQTGNCDRMAARFGPGSSRTIQCRTRPRCG